MGMRTFLPLLFSTLLLLGGVAGCSGGYGGKKGQNKDKDQPVPSQKTTART
jgi:hypothetical protein